MKTQIKKKNRGKKFLVFLSIAVVTTMTIAVLVLVNLGNTNLTNTYTITWENYDGVVLETDENVKYGSMPSYDGAIPTRSESSQYSYTFSGWSPTITLVKGNQTYTAVFGNSLNSYTITWENYDGATLEVDEGVAYGTMPSYDGAIPTKSGDAQYSYAFSGWSPEVTSVTSSATYTAQFTSSTNAYTITWKNYDGTTLEVDSGVTYGATPTYDGETPTKSGDSQYSYAFSGWSPEVTSVTSNATYTAQFTSSTNAYTITWKNYDDTVLEVDEEVLHGTLPTYDGETPTKSGDAQYEYTFKEWTPEVAMATSDQTYIATYLENVKNYTITWENYDGATLEVDSGVNYGTTPSYNGSTPIKTSNDEYSYTFIGWSPTISDVIGDATYTAQFSEDLNAYTITWKNYDGVILEVDSGVTYGLIPSYNGATPTRSGSAQYSYTFSGWSPTVTSVTGNITYTAQFTSSTNAYTITWKNYDGVILEVDSGVTYGATPTYDGETPTKSGDAQYSYAFSGWSPAVTSVSGNQTYTAQFNEIENGLKKGDTYQFGTYPQTKVTDSSLISTLTTAAGTLPTSANAQAWTSYGYYISSSAATSYMWYIDLVNGSDEYRGVYFTSYRPYYTSSTSSTVSSYQDDNGYSTSNVYWFKYEPITWRVLDVQAGKAFLMADLVLDSQDYHYSTSTRTIGGSTVYSNNYKESHIRSWLNDSFYNTAFSTEEKARIQTTTVDNSFASTGYSSNPYACANTSDKVFLLSYAEATSATYGLSTTTSRQLGPSAYAKAQGVYTNTNGFNLWWLRSPDDSDRVNNARIVGRDGSVINSNFVLSTYRGVVPALWISL